MNNNINVNNNNNNGVAGEYSTLDIPFDTRSGPPRSHTCMSIFSTFCCCFLFGIVAFVYSMKTRTANKNEDEEKAKEYSRKSVIFNCIGIAIGSCTILGGILYGFIRLGQEITYLADHDPYFG